MKTALLVLGIFLLVASVFVFATTEEFVLEQDVLVTLPDIVSSDVAPEQPKLSLDQIFVQTLLTSEQQADLAALPHDPLVALQFVITQRFQK